MNKSRLKRWLPLAALVFAGLAVYLLGWHRYLNFEQLAENREAVTGFVKAWFWPSLLAYMLVYALVVALSLPVGIFITVLGGFLFGPLLGGTATVFSATGGALAVFLIARSSLGESLKSQAGPFVEKLRAGFRDHALSYLLFLRLVPLFPFWLVNIAPALVGVSTPTYILGTFFGIIPATYAFSYVGGGLGSVIDAQAAARSHCLAGLERGAAETACPSFSLNPGDLVTPELVLALVGLALIALLPMVVKKMRTG